MSEAGSNSPDDIDYSFVRGGLLHRMLSKVGLGQLGSDEIRLRIGLFIFVTYVPMLLLAFAQNVAWGNELKIPFLFDIVEASRFLLAGSLLIAAEAFVEPWLLNVVRHTRDRLISQVDLPRYDKLIASGARWRNSSLVEVLFLVGTFALQFVEGQVVPPTATTTWHQLASGDPTYAYDWCIYIAKPLMRFLWLRWFWRYAIWSLFLMRLSNMPLKIKPAYPDYCGGLGFIAAGHARLAVLALTFGIQASSILGAQILFEGKTLISFKYEIVGFAILILLIFLAPLITFTGKLLEAKRLGLSEYGTLADEYISKFHHKWIDGDTEGENLLGTADIQSLADLNSTYEVVQAMHISLLSKGIILTFLGAALLPFLPLVLTVYPFDELVRHLLKAMF